MFKNPLCVANEKNDAEREFKTTKQGRPSKEKALFFIYNSNDALLGWRQSDLQ